MPDLEAAREVACRECRAGATQARGMDLAWRCMEHGVVRLNDYERDRLTNPSPELVEAVAQSLTAYLWGRTVNRLSPEMMQGAARAALQAARGAHQ